MASMSLISSSGTSFSVDGQRLANGKGMAPMRTHRPSIGIEPSAERRRLRGSCCTAPPFGLTGRPDRDVDPRDQRAGERGVAGSFREAVRTDGFWPPCGRCRGWRGGSVVGRRPRRMVPICAISSRMFCALAPGSGLIGHRGRPLIRSFWNRLPRPISISATRCSCRRSSSSAALASESLITFMLTGRG